MTFSESPPSNRFRWVSALLISVSAAVFVDAVIYTRVRPEYEAFSLLRLAPPAPSPFSPPKTGEDAREARDIAIETAMAILRSDHILNSAIADPSIKNETSLRGSASPREDLRADLKVANVPNTDFIRVSYVSHSPEEAATIVNAVVSSHLQAASEFEDGSEDLARRQLEAYLSRTELPTSEFSQAVARLNRLGVVSPDDSSPTSFTSLTEDLRRTTAERLIQADLELAREGDGPKAAELKRTQSVLRALVALPDSDSGSAQVEVARLGVEAAAGRFEEARRKLEEVKLTNSRSWPRSTLVDRAATPKVPIRDLRAPLMSTATALILLVGLAVALHRGEPRATGEPVADGV